MPRTHQPPMYRLHKARQSAVVTIDGRNRYLGPYGSILSYRRYLDELAAWVTGKCGAPLPCSAAPHEEGLVVGELILQYWKFAQSYYVKAGRPTDEQACIRAALRPLRQLYGAAPVRSFKATDLKRVRAAMIQSGLSRNTINGYVERIRRMFRWGVSEDLVEPALLASLMAVEGLHRDGRKRARRGRLIRFRVPISRLSCPICHPCCR